MKFWKYNFLHIFSLVFGALPALLVYFALAPEHDWVGPVLFMFLFSYGTGFLFYFAALQRHYQTILPLAHAYIHLLRRTQHLEAVLVNSRSIPSDDREFIKVYMESTVNELNKIVGTK